MQGRRQYGRPITPAAPVVLRLHTTDHNYSNSSKVFIPPAAQAASIPAQAGGFGLQSRLEAGHQQQLLSWLISVPCGTKFKQSPLERSSMAVRMASCVLAAVSAWRCERQADDQEQICWSSLQAYRQHAGKHSCEEPDRDESMDLQTSLRPQQCGYDPACWQGMQ